ncbi:uncharacterized protein LOC144377431 [Ictidomys tridecemlineatus]
MMACLPSDLMGCQEGHSHPGQGRATPGAAPGLEPIEGRPRDWPRPADPARVPRQGVALRARAGAARTAVPAPPPQSAPRSARTCRRRRAEPRAPSPAPAPLGAARARHRRRSPPEPPELPEPPEPSSHPAKARAPHPGLPLRQPLRRRRGPGTPGWGSSGLVQASPLIVLRSLPPRSSCNQCPG